MTNGFELTLNDEEMYWRARILRNQHRDAWNYGRGNPRHDRIRRLLDGPLEVFEREHPHVKGIACPDYEPLPKDDDKFRE